MKKFLSTLIALSIMNGAVLKDVKADTPENVLAGESVVKELEEKESELTFAEKLAEKLTAVEEFVKDHSNTILLTIAGVTGAAGVGFTGYNVTTGRDALKTLWAKGNALSLKEKVKETMRIMFCGVTKSSGESQNNQSEQLTRSGETLTDNSEDSVQGQADTENSAEKIVDSMAEDNNNTELAEDTKDVVSALGAPDEVDNLAEETNTTSTSTEENLTNSDSEKKIN